MNDKEIYMEILIDLIKQTIESAERMVEENPNRYAYQAGVYEQTIADIKRRIEWYEEKTKGESEDGNDVVGDQHTD